MSSKMQVLFVIHTSHVLAAFTRTADPEGKLKVEDLVGTALPVRGASPVPSVANKEPLLVPPEMLDVATVELAADAFVTPSAFVVSGTKLDAIGSVSPSSPDLTFDYITIKTASNVPENTKVWAQIQQAAPPAGEEPLRRVVAGEIPSTTAAVKLALTSLPGQPPASIPVGDYDAVILVAGQQPLFTRLTAAASPLTPP
jgi:hypothetical protein